MASRDRHSLCPTSYCYNADLPGRPEFGGFCAECWATRLTSAQRAIIKGEEPLVKEIIHTETIVHHREIPPRSHVLLGRLWKLTMTGAVAWLAYAQWRQS